VNALFRVGSMQNSLQNALQTLASVDPSGLSLSARFYTGTDAASVAKRTQYFAYAAKVLQQLGASAADAQAQADTVLAVETRLAQSFPTVAGDSAFQTFHPLGRPGLAASAPHFAWDEYFGALGLPNLQQINLSSPDYLHGMDGAINSFSLSTLKTYLRWQLIKSAIPTLGSAFAPTALIGTTLNGARTDPALDSVCMSQVSRNMVDALARPFIAKTFSATARTRAESIIHAITKAMDQNLATAPWLDFTTRLEAETKLHKVEPLIGFADYLDTYDDVTIDPASFYANVVALRSRAKRKDLDSIGRPLDRQVWEMAPYEVNAYYTADLNDIVFPAGILQKPFFSRTAPALLSFAAIGSVMGHELTHGFDDSGRLYDGDGNLRDWWSTQAATEFQTRAQCLIDQYSGYQISTGDHVDGELTLGENIADNGGVRLALAAARARRSQPQTVAGFSPDQQFFVAYAQMWCQKVRPEVEPELLQDVHSPNQFRVTGPLSNMGEFQQAFQCAASDAMVRPSPCRVW
jgi:predicted metalloendopeptidase